MRSPLRLYSLHSMLASGPEPTGRNSDPQPKFLDGVVAWPLQPGDVAWPGSPIVDRQRWQAAQHTVTFALDSAVHTVSDSRSGPVTVENPMELAVP
jgi:hypothetical protein